MYSIKLLNKEELISQSFLQMLEERLRYNNTIWLIQRNLNILNLYSKFKLG